MGWTQILLEGTRDTLLLFDRHPGLATWVTSGVAVGAAIAFGRQQVQIARRQTALYEEQQRQARLELYSKWQPGLRGSTELIRRDDGTLWVDVRVRNESDKACSVILFGAQVWATPDQQKRGIGVGIPKRLFEPWERYSVTMLVPKSVVDEVSPHTSHPFTSLSCCVSLVDGRKLEYSIWEDTAEISAAENGPLGILEDIGKGNPMARYEPTAWETFFYLPMLRRVFRRPLSAGRRGLSIVRRWPERIADWFKRKRRNVEHAVWVWRLPPEQRRYWRKPRR